MEFMSDDDGGGDDDDVRVRRNNARAKRHRPHTHTIHRTKLFVRRHLAWKILFPFGLLKRRFDEWENWFSVLKIWKWNINRHEHRQLENKNLFTSSARLSYNRRFDILLSRFGVVNRLESKVKMASFIAGLAVCCEAKWWDRTWANWTIDVEDDVRLCVPASF